MEPLSLRRAVIVTITLLATATLAACTSAASPTESPKGDPPPNANAESGVSSEYRLSTGFPMTVIDRDGPRLCQGIVLQSNPPSCGGGGGLALTGWDWDRWEGHYEERSGVRWGDFWVAGTYDAAASTFAVAEVVPDGGFDRSGLDTTDPFAAQSEGTPLSEVEWEKIRSEIGASAVPALVIGKAGSTVFVHVTYDEGSIQRELDDRYGPGLVEVTSVLVPWP